jgi:ATP-dependent protease ClpP protease subunit
MNEIILYSALDEYSAGQLIYQLNWIGENQVYAVRMYCPGGDVEASWGIPAKMQELKQKGCHSIAKVDGMAASMAGVLLCFFDEREALDVSNIMLHRAAYAEKDREGNPIIQTPEDKQRLAKINADLKAKMQQVIDDRKLKAIKGISVDDLFDEKKKRINLWLNAGEAREIGLITKVIPIDANSSQYMVKAVAACYGTPQGPKATAATAGNNQQKMTAEEFQKENPEEYKKIREAAVAEAVKAQEAKAKAEAESGNRSGAGAQVDLNVVDQLIEKKLKALGLNNIEGIQPPQTAAATAAQTARAAQEEADKKAKAEADKKVLDEVKAEIENIKSGKA